MTENRRRASSRLLYDRDVVNAEMKRPVASMLRPALVLALLLVARSATASIPTAALERNQLVPALEQSALVDELVAAQERAPELEHAAAFMPRSALFASDARASGTEKPHLGVVTFWAAVQQERTLAKWRAQQGMRGSEAEEGIGNTTFHLYYYANANPLKYVDPDGHQSVLDEGAYNLVPDQRLNVDDLVYRVPKKPGEVADFIENRFKTNPTRYSGPLTVVEANELNDKGLSKLEPATLNDQQRVEAKALFGDAADAAQLYSNYASRHRLLMGAVLSDPAFQDLVTAEYRLMRDVNPVAFAFERGYQIGSGGDELFTGQQVDPLQAVMDLYLTASLLKMPGMLAGGPPVQVAGGADVGLPMRSAADIHAGLPGRMSQKAVATVGDEAYLSGWAATPEGFSRVSPDVTLGYAERMGLTLRRSGALDHGVPGRWAATHAEIQTTIRHPGRASEVSSETCTSCISIIKQRAVATGVNQPVVDPSGLAVYTSEGGVITSPRSFGSVYQSGPSTVVMPGPGGFTGVFVYDPASGFRVERR